jgi:predicted NUDIX family NTP pyrophosphohydrolase
MAKVYSTATQYGRISTVWPPMSQKFCAIPKIGAYNFCSLETVDLVKVFQKQEGFLPNLKKKHFHLKQLKEL